MLVDVNNQEIKAFDGFPNDPEVSSIELGAGTNYFGKKFFPNCYLTDKDELIFNDYSHFMVFHPDYEKSSCHYNDIKCDIFSDSSMIPDNRFKTVIFCNPYGYGFRYEDKAVESLNLVGRILESGGKLIILNHISNPWAQYNETSRLFNLLKEENRLSYEFQISELTEMDSTHPFLIDHRYYTSKMGRETKPNQLYSFIKN